MVVTVMLGGFSCALALEPPPLDGPMSSRSAQAKCDLLGLGSALEEFAHDHAGRFPEDLDASITPDAHGRTYLMIDHVRLDPWRRPYLYALPVHDGERPCVRTLGRDGLADDERADADMDSAQILAENDSRP
jgi:Type II secretion system (T2SS), protein G